MRKSDDVTNEEYASFFHSCVTCMILCENSMEPLTVSKAVLLQHSTSDIMADVLSIAWTELLGEKAIWEFRRRLLVDMRHRVTCMILCENSIEPLTVSKAVLLQHSTFGRCTFDGMDRIIG